MKHLVIGLLLVGLSLWSPCLGDDAQTVRVLSYNIHHGQGIDGKLDLVRIANVILSVKADLVALQEVDQNVRRSGNVDQPAELAQLTNMNVVFGANIKLQGGRYGNAILSRWPIKRHENHLLPKVDDGEQRGVIEAEVVLPDVNRSVIMFVTHLDHRPDDRERVASAKVINKLIARQSSQPAVLAGDLNDTPESEALSLLEKMWTRVNREPLPTIPVGRPTKQIDFIMFRPAKSWKFVEVKVLDEAIASDHRAIFTVLELETDVRETSQE